jgi:hypothetical protein
MQNRIIFDISRGIPFESFLLMIKSDIILKHSFDLSISKKLSNGIS